MADFDVVTPDGKLQLAFHPGQMQAWESDARIVAVIAGTQSGKTCFGPHWLNREIQRCGPGDYMIVTPTFPLLELKALTEFRRLFEDRLALGKYVASPARRFIFSAHGRRKMFGEDVGTATTVFFGYASDPDSLESATAKAAWLDEAGQRAFKLSSFQAIRRRLSIHQGRTLITTTPYNLGWLKTEIWDKWKGGDPRIQVVRFESIMNPAFPRQEYDEARRDLPGWKFDLFYRALFTKPAGLIYDSFDEVLHKIPRFAIPDEWPRFLGLDFGGVNTAGLFYAQKPESKQYFLYREYKAGGKTAKGHAQAVLHGEPTVPTCVGGSRSEGQWRQEFRAGGLPVRPPDIADVEVGIDRVYGAHARGEVLVFDDLAGYLEEKLTYSRELDAAEQPTEKIEDKESFHYMDAERYIIGWLNRPSRNRQARSYQG